MPACRELGIGFVPFSPLGRGFLTGGSGRPTTSARPTSAARAAASGREPTPNLATSNWSARSRRHGATSGQVALAWVHAQGDDVVPIPGTKRRTYLEENVAAVDVTLTAEDMERLGAIGEGHGDRYADMSPVGR